MLDYAKMREKIQVRSDDLDQRLKKLLQTTTGELGQPYADFFTAE